MNAGAPMIMWNYGNFAGLPAPAHFQYGPLIPRFIFPLQKPMSAQEIYLRIQVSLHLENLLEEIVKKIIPNGQRSGSVYTDGFIVVALEEHFSAQINTWILPGQWIRKEISSFGRNVVELYAFIHGCQYIDAVNALAAHMQINNATGLDRQCDALRGWEQERNPLNLQSYTEYNSMIFPENGSIAFYKNSSGNIIGSVMRWPLQNGETAIFYNTLWRRHKSNKLSVMPIFPEKPLMLFNADYIAQHADRDVCFVEDEFLANDFSLQNAGIVFSAIPGGFGNFLDADLSALRDRRTHVILRQEDICRGKLIRQKLMKAGVQAPHFAVGVTDQFKPFDTIEAIAAKYGIEMIPLQDAFDSSPAIVISQPGEMIPGRDMDRRILLDPIIKEGYIIWLYAEPKIGKTWLGLAIAYVVASQNGTLGKWHSAEPFGVLYVDGEMLPDELEQSIAMIMNGAGHASDAPPFARLCAKNQPEGFIDIAAPEWQQQIEKEMKGKSLLILDNFQSLTDNGQGALNVVRPWLMRITKAGIAVLVLDHTNREGELQGSATKERMANLSIALRYPDEAAKGDGRILVEFPVARRLHGEDAAPFQMRKCFTDFTFSFHVLAEPKAAVLSELSADDQEHALRMAMVVFLKVCEKLTFKEIAERIGCQSAGTPHSDYHKTADLNGAKKAAFEAELNRLKIKAGYEDI